jgi:kynureninase
VVITRVEAEALDRSDPLTALHDQFVAPAAGVIALDGNSLGRPPAAIGARLEALVHEWSQRRVEAWDDWMQLPVAVGDLLASEFLGARPGEVVVCDSTTVNLYKLGSAALAAVGSGRSVIVTDDDNFPTDRYVLAGLAERVGGSIRFVTTDPIEGVDPDQIANALTPDVALLSLSHVAYRSGALLDMAAVNDIVHEAGALVLWDLCHSAGSVPVRLDATGADLAVGCTYKYLNGGPGAPAFLYVRSELQGRLRSPIQGWFGQRDQFEMGPAYEPADGIERFAVGTPPVIAMAAVDVGAGLVAEAGIDALAAKGQELSDLIIALADEWLAPHGVVVASPRDGARRGSHVSLAHPAAWQLTQALVERGMVPDYRTPDRVRLGPAPIYTRFVDVWDAMDRFRSVLADRSYERYPAQRARVT